MITEPVTFPASGPSARPHLIPTTPAPESALPTLLGLTKTECKKAARVILDLIPKNNDIRYLYSLPLLVETKKGRPIARDVIVLRSDAPLLSAAMSALEQVLRSTSNLHVDADQYELTAHGQRLVARISRR